ncbi:hypothetical protein AB0G32_36685 [Streptomyces sp. NPDC023723]|uniref:hypothetical protein n=1 Tax=Streptomyces sp. NPDC023723 TaxID=3154323 RepID=UPI0033E2AAEE
MNEMDGAEHKDIDVTVADEAHTYRPSSLGFAAVLAAAGRRSDSWDRPEETGVPGDLCSPGTPASIKTTRGNDAYRLGNRAAARTDWGTAKTWYEEAVDHGHPGAAFRLARVFLELCQRQAIGDASGPAIHDAMGMGKTIEAGLLVVHWLRRAAEWGHGDAARVLDAARRAREVAAGASRLSPEDVFRYWLLGDHAHNKLTNLSSAREALSSFEPFQAEDPETLTMLADCAYPVISFCINTGSAVLHTGTSAGIRKTRGSSAATDLRSPTTSQSASGTPASEQTELPMPLVDAARELQSWFPTTRMELRGALLEILRSLAKVTDDAYALAEALEKRELALAGSRAHALRRDSCNGLSRARVLARGHDRFRPIACAMAERFTYKLPADLPRARRFILLLANETQLAQRALARVGSDFQGCDLSSLDLEWVPLEGVRWNLGTCWPAGWEERVRHASEQQEPGVFIVRAEPKRCPSLSMV